MTVQTAVEVPLVLRSSGALQVARLCLLEARPVVQGIFLVRFVAGALLAHHLTAGNPGRIVAGAAAWWCATVFVYLLNGVTDVAEDRANGSRRPVASGQLSLEAARAACAGLAILSVLLAACVNPTMTVLVVVFLGLGYAYSAEPFALKNRSLGSMAMALLGGLSTYAAGYDVVGGAQTGRLLVFSAALSCWMGLVGVQAKDLSDVEGDSEAGRRTIAMRWRDRTVRMVLVLTAVGVGLCLTVAAAFIAQELLPVAIVMLIGALILAASALTGHSRGEREVRRRPYRIFMVTQYAAHLSLLISVCAA